MCDVTVVDDSADFCKTMKPELEQTREWYQKAAGAGHTQAMVKTDLRRPRRQKPGGNP